MNECIPTLLIYMLRGRLDRNAMIEGLQGTGRVQDHLMFFAHVPLQLET